MAESWTVVDKPCAEFRMCRLEISHKVVMRESASEFLCESVLYFLVCDMQMCDHAREIGLSFAIFWKCVPCMEII